MSYISPTDALTNINKASVFSLTNIATGMKIDFKPYDMEYSDNFSADWEQKTPFGRLDPIAIYKSTKRRLSFSFTLTSPDFNEAFWNLQKVNLLTLSMYPVYKSAGSGEGSNVFEKVPLVRIKYAIIDGLSISDTGSDTSSGRGTSTGESDFRGKSTNYKGIPITTGKGVSGFIESLDIKTEGSIGHHPIELPDSEGEHVMIPKTFKISISFVPIHDSLLGLSQDEDDRFYSNTNAFPYIANNNMAGDKGKGGTLPKIHDHMGQTSIVNPSKQKSEIESTKKPGPYEGGTLGPPSNVEISEPEENTGLIEED